MGKSGVCEKWKESNQELKGSRLIGNRAIMPMHVYTAFPAFEPSHPASRVPLYVPPLRPTGLPMPY